jgi:hypothetical protein
MWVWAEGHPTQAIMDVRTFYRTASSLRLFLEAGRDRGMNDANNKARELILAGLYESADPSLQTLRTSWMEFLRSLCSEPFDTVDVKQKGGRGANYDFMIRFLRSGSEVKHVPSEFKHNASHIDALPQYFSPAADKPYLARSYAEVFYDSFLGPVCAVYPGIAKPDKDVYLRLVYNNDYDRHTFFRALYDAEEAGTKDQYTQKQRIVCESIRMYLADYANSLDLALLSKDIRERQSGKVFILWDTKTFRSDTIRDEEMDLTHVEGVKNGNTIVVVSKSGTKHNMLLRWKNHLGILYPAWQISLSR